MEINITLLWQIVVLLLLFVWLSKVLFAPMLAVFEERERRIDGAKREAAQLESEAQNKMEEVQRRVEESMALARSELSNLKNEGLLIQRKMIDDAKHSAKAKMDQASKELRVEMDRTRKDLRVHVQELAHEVLSKVLNPNGDASSKSSQSKMEVSGA